jgi:glutamine amidotransferase
MKVVIIDYLGGNLFSILKAFKYIGVETIVSKNPEDWFRGDAVVFPGQGNFAQAISELKKDSRDKALKEILKNKYFLGICLGLQILFEESEESKLEKGLGVFKGKVKKLPAKKIPHLGWNNVEFEKQGRLLNGIPNNSFFYFVHSYYVNPEEDVIIGLTEYSIKFPSYIERENIFGVQFHPEKSSSYGIRLLENFIKECKK